MKKDLVFSCSKCSHELYVSVDKLVKLPKSDCPECGEEAWMNWTFVKFGNFAKDYPHLVKKSK